MHTSFFDQNMLRLEAKDLDHDYRVVSFPQDFFIDLIFEDLREKESPEMKESNQNKKQSQTDAFWMQMNDYLQTRKSSVPAVASIYKEFNTTASSSSPDNSKSSTVQVNSSQYSKDHVIQELGDLLNGDDDV